MVRSSGGLVDVFYYVGGVLFNFTLIKDVYNIRDLQTIPKV